MKKLILFVLVSLVTLTNLQAKSFNIVRWQTKNGAHVVFYQAMEVPMLTVMVGFAAGSAYDDQQFGLSMLTSNLLTQGSGGMNANTIAEKLADTGARFDTANNRDMLLLNLTTLTNPTALKPALNMFEQILTKPNFSPDALSQEKKQQLMLITQMQEAPEGVANQALFQKLYQTHPYAHPLSGNKTSVKALTLEQVRSFYRRYCVAANATIVLVGAIDKPQAEQIATQLSQHLAQGQPAKLIPPASPLKTKEKVSIPFTSSQTTLQLAQIGITHHNPDYFALMVGNHILGGGALVSRLAEEVREKRGLSYSANSQLMPMPGNGAFIISLTTQNQQAGTALAVTEKTLAQFIAQGPTAEELTYAKQYLTGNFPLSLSSNSSIASGLLRMAFYHLPEEFLDTYIAQINAVTTADIQQAFAKLIDPNKLLIIRVGQA